MSETPITLDQLRKMIGDKVSYQGLDYQIIEVLDDGPSVVLRSLSTRDMQMDQYEESARRVPEVVTVPVLTHDQASLSQAFADITQNR